MAFPEAADRFQYALSSNRAWAGYKAHQNPEYFQKLSAGQSPTILWLGCADSRVPETTILGCQPGDIFVHRNIGNIVSPTDINTTAVIEFAVSKLKVKHVVLCGHTQCGGAAAALRDDRIGGVLDTWLTPIKSLRYQHADELSGIKCDSARAVRIAELNVEAGIRSLMGHWAIQEGMREWGLQVHGCIFEIHTGKIRDLSLGTSMPTGPIGTISTIADEDVVRGKHGMLVFQNDGNVGMVAT